MRIVVLGYMGMLGKRVLSRALAEGHEVVTPSVPESKRPVRLMAINKFDLDGDVVINCAGIVKQRPSDLMETVLTNAYAPHYIARLCSEIGNRLIHVSSDCVFSHPGPHYEGDPVSPEDFYGKTKLAGEVGGKHLTVRCSFIGYSTRGLIHEILNSEEIRASNRLLWNGHTAEFVAESLIRYAENPIEGLLHLPGEHISRYHLVRKLCGFLNVHPRIVRDDNFVADRRLGSQRLKWAAGMPPTLDEQLLKMQP